MSLESLVGSTYGPFPVRVSAEQVAAYVAVTGDNATRWVKYAPPSMAGALLFAAAPAFLNSAAVRPHTRLLVHTEQKFDWNRALEIDENVSVEGTLARVRARGGVSFVTFDCSVGSGDDDVLTASSTFLMGDGDPAEAPVEQTEPPVGERAAFSHLPDDLPLVPGPVPDLQRSASRLDLVRYAAASGDFNPIHFDHATAVRAGFPGVLVHGLLMGAWLIQLAAAHSPNSTALASAALRFRNPLRPGEQASVGGDVRDISSSSATLRLGVQSGGSDVVTGRFRLRIE